MKNETKIGVGILITGVIFTISALIKSFVKIPIEFIPSGFWAYLMILILSEISIYFFQSKGVMTFKLKRFKVKVFFMAILTSLIAFAVVNILSAVIFKIFHISFQEKDNPLLKYSPYQCLLLIWIGASIAEELLFRGFLLNMLAPLSSLGVKIFKTKISLSAIISGVLFGLTHLMVLTSGASVAFVLKFVFITTTLGIIAGYFQEKYENNTSVAIVVHMTINAIGCIGIILASTIQ